MAKGSIAKANLLDKFKTALGQDYVGMDSDGKKAYFWSTENGERMQVCISMTVPKTPLNGSSIKSNELDFDEKAPATAAMGEDEQATLNRLMEELGLSIIEGNN